MRMPAEQRRNFVAVNKSFQARRQVLLDQRQAIYARLQRQSTRYNNAEDTVAEFLKVWQMSYQLPLHACLQCQSTRYNNAEDTVAESLKVCQVSHQLPLHTWCFAGL